MSVMIRNLRAVCCGVVSDIDADAHLKAI